MKVIDYSENLDTLIDVLTIDMEDCDVCRSDSEAFMMTIDTSVENFGEASIKCLSCNTIIEHFTLDDIKASLKAYIAAQQDLKESKDFTYFESKNIDVLN